jgi:lipocalin
VESFVDLKRYMGTWYEIARYPHRFQEGRRLCRHHGDYRLQ